MIDNFIYKDILLDFKSYLDNNHSETVYFETLNLSKNNEGNIDFSYRKLLQNNKFTLNKVLDNYGTVAYAKQIHTLRKVRKYEEYAFDTLTSLTKKSKLEDRLNSIQAICSFSHFSNRNHFYNVYDHNENFPVSVKLSYHNFDLQFSNKPFNVLSDLLETINEDKMNRELYFNFLTYYYSKETIGKRIKELLINDKREYNDVAFLIAILYTSGDRENKLFNAEKGVIKNFLMRIKSEIPKDLDSKYNLSEQIKFAFSE